MSLESTGGLQAGRFEYDSGGRLKNAPFVNELFQGGEMLEWLMSPVDQMAFLYLLERQRPRVAIEIGSRFGGSLQILSRYCEKIYSLDIDPEVPKRLAGKFPNVEYITGSSPETLPPLLRSLQECGAEVGFILVDGDHSAEGVRKDIECILAYTPVVPLCIVMHDSFNPECREGLRAANWEANPHVQFVELDFTAGQVSTQPESPDQRWGGLALAMMTPEKRTGPLRITGRADRTIYYLERSILAFKRGNRKRALREWLK